MSGKSTVMFGYYFYWGTGTLGTFRSICWKTKKLGRCYPAKEGFKPDKYQIWVKKSEIEERFPEFFEIRKRRKKFEEKIRKKRKNPG